MGIAIMTWIDGRHYSRDLRDIARNGLTGPSYGRYRDGLQAMRDALPGHAVEDHLGATIAQVALRDRAMKENPHVQRKPGTAAGMMEISVAGDAFLFERSGRQVFEFSRELAAELAVTDVDDVTPEELQMPYDGFYVRIPDLPDLDGVQLDGLLMTRSLTTKGLCARVRPMAADLPDGRPGREFSSAALPLEGDRPVIDMIREESERMDAISRTRDRAEDVRRMGPEMEKVGEEIDGASERARRLLAEIQATAINVLLYIDNCARHTRRGWSPDAPAEDVAKVETRATGCAKVEQRLVRNGWTRVTLCQLETVCNTAAAADTDSQRRPVRAHMRRGHWRRQRHGPGATLVKRIRIRPSLVGAAQAVEMIDGRTYVAGQDVSR